MHDDLEHFTLLATIRKTHRRRARILIRGHDAALEYAANLAPIDIGHLQAGSVTTLKIPDVHPLRVDFRHRGAGPVP